MKPVLLLPSFLFTLFLISSINAQHNKEHENVSLKKHYTKGKFITIDAQNGAKYKVYAAGPEDATVAIVFVHDYFGITEAAKHSVERLGSLGYQTVAVDLYDGETAKTNDSATILMNEKKPERTKFILKSVTNYLKRPGRKLASVGFSAGGIDALKVNLMQPELFKATAIIYAGNYDKIEAEILDKLSSPFLAITGSDDEWALKAALNFMQLKPDKPLELYIYPGAKHGYSQPLFSNGANYDLEATRLTWLLLEDFLERHL